MKTRNIYIVGGDRGYANWMEGKIVDGMMDADLVVFTGGEDVSPDFYGEPKHPTTGNNPYRDHKEKDAFLKAKGMGKKIIGICRGSQFLCVMAGGKLVQDQETQPHYHKMKTLDGREILVSSTHHQAQWPWNLNPKEYEVLGFTEGLSGWHEDGRGHEIVTNVEVEVCYYPKIKALAIQSHPEYYFGNPKPEMKESIAYFQDLLNRHMAGTL